jgi:glycosyltransferase involved in cell wall biosynthesis
VRIAIDASRTTIAARTGTENYALQLIRALIALPASHQFTLYFRDEPPSNLFTSLPNVQLKVIPFSRLWTHVRFAAALWRDRPDVTFVPAHALPLIFPGKAVATVHDLGYRFFPQAHPAFERTYLDLTTRTTSRRATRILADSLATKRDLIAIYGVSGDKIDVIYPGVEGLHRATTSEIAAVRAKYKLPERYFLFLGTLQPRKNIQRLIEAFGRYCTDNADHDIGLVLTGKRGWLIEDSLRSILDALSIGQRERVILTGYIQDSEVVSLYSGALALAFPSLYEGFGFPVLEAMLCGTPVLCSNTSSLPELAGDAAVLVDPLSVKAIAAGMARLASDASLRESLVNKGFQQAAQFTWKRAAQLTLQALEVAGR